jgi:hypothetical protein
MKRLIIALVAGAALSGAPPAYAQTATLDVQCPTITFSFSGFPATGTTTITTSLSFDGAPAATATLPPFSGSSFTRTFTLVGSGVAPGTHTITGTISTTSTAGPPTSTPVSVTYVCAAAPAAAAEPARLPPPPARGAYCLNGKFLDLQLGQPALDPRYAGATPAFYYQGIGLTCDPLPAGYVLTDTLVNSSGLDIGAIDPGRIYRYARRA